MGGGGRGNRKSPLENTIKIKYSTEKPQKRLPLKITDFCSFLKIAVLGKQNIMTQVYK